MLLEKIKVLSQNEQEKDIMFVIKEQRSNDQSKRT
jgi:hypothetical protein